MLGFVIFILIMLIIGIIYLIKKKYLKAFVVLIFPAVFIGIFIMLEVAFSQEPGTSINSHVISKDKKYHYVLFETHYFLDPGYTLFRFKNGIDLNKVKIVSHNFTDLEYVNKWQPLQIKNDLPNVKFNNKTGELIDINIELIDENYGKLIFKDQSGVTHSITLDK